MSKGRATRSETLKLVPSQFTERIQARTPPLDYWGEQEQSPVDRAWCYYLAHPWMGWALLAVGCAFVGATIVVATWRVTTS